jgi:tetratricopeptide (TPR) repeat protein
MKKNLLIITLSLITLFINAQQVKITSAQTYIDLYLQKEGDQNLEKAKSEIDEAVLNEKTVVMAKAWFVKGQVYQLITESKELAPKFATVNILDEAYDAYKKAITLNDVRFRDQEATFTYLKSVCSYINNRGVDQYQANKFAEAYQSFIKLEDANTFFETNKQKFHLDLSSIRSNAGLCAQKAGMTKEAITLYEGIISKGSEDAGLYATLANMYVKEGRAEESKKLVDDAVAKFPNNVNLRITQLNFYITEGKYVEAIDKINKTIELEPKNDQLYVAAALAYDKMKDVTKCREMYLKATELDDNNLNAWYNLGGTYIEEANGYILQINALGNTKEDIAKSNELDAKKIAAYKNAKPFIEKALSLKPDDADLKRIMMKIKANLDN